MRRCKQCGNAIIQKGHDGELRLRFKGEILVKADGSTEARCFWCNTPASLGLTIPAEIIQKALAPPAPAERFVMVPKKTKLTP